MSPNRVRIDLRALREAAEQKIGTAITIGQAADMVLVSRRAWQRWENDNKTIPTGVVKRFCACTGLDPAQWLAEDAQ
jgi:hypothetical protein